MVSGLQVPQIAVAGKANARSVSGELIVAHVNVVAGLVIDVIDLVAVPAVVSEVGVPGVPVLVQEINFFTAGLKVAKHLGTYVGGRVAGENNVVSVPFVVQPRAGGEGVVGNAVHGGGDNQALDGLAAIAGLDADGRQAVWHTQGVEIRIAVEGPRADAGDALLDPDLLDLLPVTVPGRVGLSKIVHGAEAGDMENALGLIEGPAQAGAGAGMDRQLGLLTDDGNAVPESVTVEVPGGQVFVGNFDEELLGAAIKDFFAHGFRGRAQGDELGQSGTAAEGVVTNLHQSIRQTELRQARAAGKGDGRDVQGPVGNGVGPGLCGQAEDQSLPVGGKEDAVGQDEVLRPAQGQGLQPGVAVDGVIADAFQGTGQRQGSQILQIAEGVVCQGACAFPDQDGGDLLTVVRPGERVVLVIVHRPDAPDRQQAGVLVEVPEQGVAAAAVVGVGLPEADDGAALPLGDAGGVPAGLVLHYAQDQQIGGAVREDLLAHHGGQLAVHDNHIQRRAAGEDEIAQLAGRAHNQRGIQRLAVREGIVADAGQVHRGNELFQVGGAREGKGTDPHSAVGHLAVGRFCVGPADQLRTAVPVEDAVHVAEADVPFLHLDVRQGVAVDEGGAVHLVQGRGQGDLLQRGAAREGEAADPGHARAQAQVLQIEKLCKNVVAHGGHAVLHHHVADPGPNLGPGLIVGGGEVVHGPEAANGQGFAVGVKIERDVRAAFTLYGIQPNLDGVVLPGGFPVGGPLASVIGGIVDHEIGGTVAKHSAAEGGGRRAAEAGEVQIGTVLEYVAVHRGQTLRQIHLRQRGAVVERAG